jgi:hypothetical protein
LGEDAAAATQDPLNQEQPEAAEAVQDTAALAGPEQQAKAMQEQVLQTEQFAVPVAALVVPQLQGLVLKLTVPGKAISEALEYIQQFYLQDFISLEVVAVRAVPMTDLVICGSVATVALAVVVAVVPALEQQVPLVGLAVMD